MSAAVLKKLNAKFDYWAQKNKLVIRIITFLLGFYVKTIIKKYWATINKIPDAENPVLEIGGLANERLEDEFKGALVSPGGVTEWKKTLARYCLLSWTMCYNTISQPIAAKLGKGNQLIDKGLLTHEELTALVVSIPKDLKRIQFAFVRDPTPRIHTTWPTSHLIYGL